ncbi:RRM domain-containing protein [Durusdinium trenchii]|uniref:RRM domain-containing protein n=1 Tax=Durusdinium trenchii TaxID=1381693 RepID=A0ABP0SRA1_9DINO
MSTSFSGVGCAESAVMSLAKASERFLKKKGISSVGHVKLESACEIDTKCQKVLKSTYGHCVFQDITKLDIEKKEENLASYNATTDYEFPDLNQYASNDRGRGETKDCSLPTLTTTSGKIFSKAV